MVETTGAGEKKRTPAVVARGKARDRVAALRAAQRKREKDTEDDLVAFFKAQEAIATAEATRDKAIADAHRVFGEAEQRSQLQQADLVRAMRERGDRVEDIAELTELSATDVKKLLKQAAPRETTSEKPVVSSVEKKASAPSTPATASATTADTDAALAS